VIVGKFLTQETIARESVVILTKTVFTDGRSDVGSGGVGEASGFRTDLWQVSVQSIPPVKRSKRTWDFRIASL